MKRSRRRPKKLPKRDQVFNPLPRKVLRKRIPTAELLFGIGFVGVILLMGLWVRAQKDNYDPGERDISYAQLVEDSVEDTLYQAPLKRWQEPGAAVSAPVVDLGIFPLALLEGGWQIDGRVEVFDASDVYEKINGAAEQYISYGFQNLHYVTLTKENYLLTIELYDQGEFRNALGIFSEQYDSERAVESTGDVLYSLTPAGAIGRYEQYFFKIAGNTGADVIMAKTASILAELGGLPVESSTAPFAYTVLARGLKLPAHEIAYQKENVFQYDFAADFWFGGAAGDDGARVYLHQAVDAAAAGALYAQLVAEQKYEYAVVAENETEALLSHEYLNTFFFIRRRDALLYGVTGAPSQEAAESLVGRLQEAISREIETETDPAP